MGSCHGQPGTKQAQQKPICSEDVSVWFGLSGAAFFYRRRQSNKKNPMWECQCVASVEKETTFSSLPEEFPVLNYIMWTDILPSSEQLWILKFVLLHCIYISFATESHIFSFPLISFFVFSYFRFHSLSLYCYLLNPSLPAYQSSASHQNVYSSFSSDFLNCSCFLEFTNSTWLNSPSSCL